MIDAQAQRLAQIQNDTDERIDREVADKDAKDQAEERARMEKARADLIATHISRQQQLKWKADAKTQEAREKEYYRSQLGELNARLRNEEIAKTQADRAERRRLDDFLFEQMAEAKARELAERQEEVDMATKMEQFLKVLGAVAGWRDWRSAHAPSGPSRRMTMPSTKGTRKNAWTSSAQRVARPSPWSLRSRARSGSLNKFMVGFLDQYAAAAADQLSTAPSVPS